MADIADTFISDLDIFNKFSEATALLSENIAKVAFGIEEILRNGTVISNFVSGIEPLFQNREGRDPALLR